MTWRIGYVILLYLANLVHVRWVDWCQRSSQYDSSYAQCLADEPDCVSPYHPGYAWLFAMGPPIMAEHQVCTYDAHKPLPRFITGDTRK